MEAILDAGLRLHERPAVARRARAAGPPRARGRRHARQDRRRPRCSPGSSSSAGLAPGFLIGGVPLDFGVSARLGERGATAPFVIEADEYDTAFFDKRSKFVHYRPRTAILNNLEFDHADIFDDLAAIERQFHHLVRTVPRQGRLVVNGRDDSAAARARDGLLERGAALRRAQGRARHAARARRAARVRRAARRPEDRARRVAAARRAQPAQRAGGDRRGRARRRRAGRVGARARRLRATCGAGSSCAAPSTASRSTTTSRTTRPRSAPRSTACAARSATRAHPRRLRAALEHDEARRDEGAAAVGARGSRPRVLPRRRPGLGRRRRRSRRSARAPSSAPTIDELVARVVAAARPGDHVLCMSNGGFGGIHAKLLDALALPAAPPLSAPARRDRPAGHAPALPARLSLVAAIDQGAQGRRLGRRAPARRGLVRARSCRASPARGDGACSRAHRRAGRASAMAVIGSSLGGFYATIVAERPGCRAVLLNPAVDPARDLAGAHRRDDRVAQRRAVRLPRRVRRRAARARAAGALTRPGALSRGHRQGRRGAVVARDERRATPAAPIKLIEGSDHALSDFDAHCPRCSRFLGLEPPHQRAG